MSRHRFLIATLWFMWWPAAAAAQGPEKACGELRSTEWELEAFAELFLADEFDWFRADIGIERLEPGAARTVVAEPRTCRNVVRAVRKVLREIYESAPQLNSLDYAIFQFGPYYAVLLRPRQIEGADIAGYSDLLVFRSDTLEYLGSILV